jgi:hypothetical protein
MLLVLYIPRAGVTWAHVACIGMGSRQGGSGIRTEEYIGISFLFSFLGPVHHGGCFQVLFKVYAGL